MNILWSYYWLILLVDTVECYTVVNEMRVLLSLDILLLRMARRVLAVGLDSKNFVSFFLF